MAPNGLNSKQSVHLRYLGRRFASRADESFAKYFFVPQDPIFLVLAVVKKLFFAVGCWGIKGTHSDKSALSLLQGQTECLTCQTSSLYSHFVDNTRFFNPSPTQSVINVLKKEWKITRHHETKSCSNVEIYTCVT